ncbi:unnamed protein product [Arctia plantaginis]|uniref:Uncharacterized protein n=1 Tax=Arctia plantaginis TaxID=874455 RepID=A0A8S0ZX38_ARCPL|nr:unnamed protein product [Arctia plantaginis]
MDKRMEVFKGVNDAARHGNDVSCRDFPPAKPSTRKLDRNENVIIEVNNGQVKSFGGIRASNIVGVARAPCTKGTDHDRTLSLIACSFTFIVRARCTYLRIQLKVTCNLVLRMHLTLTAKISISSIESIEID